MRINPAALNGLPTQERSLSEASLTEYSLSEQGSPLWHFFYPPAALSFSGQTSYNEQPTLAARETHWQYGYTSGLRLEIPNLYLDSWCIGRSLQPLLDGLNELRKAKISEGIYAPKVLSFAFGGRYFGPCVLTQISWDEAAWLSGAPARVQLSLTLQEIPKPPQQDQAGSDPAKNPQAAARETAGKPRLPLTFRQRQDGSAKAKEWLSSNKEKLPEAVRSLVQSGSFKLETDDDSGDVTMLDASGKEIGVVGRWDGKTFKTESVQTF